MRLRNGISQKHLEDVVQGLFPTAKLQVNARQDSTLKNPKTGQSLEVDIWISDLNLCFEFQDEYHYNTTWYAHRSIYDIQQADSLKLQLLFNKTQTIIYVPYWWVGDASSLQATVAFYRPELIPPTLVEPIPINPPPSVDYGIPDIKDLMLASFPKDPPMICDENPWWMGEKYDGIRVCWHPIQHRLYSRTGQDFTIPVHVSHFGSVFIDGEFWCGRGAYGEAIRTLMSEPHFQKLAFARYIAFDTPKLNADGFRYEHRFGILLSTVSASHPCILVAFRAKCTSENTLLAWAKSVIDKEGEGMMLRQLGSLYLPGRSSVLLKFKSMSDSEALVVSSVGTSVKLQLPSGRLITVSHNEPLKRGEVVTFGYASATQVHNPANVAIHRVRKDVTWQDVLSQSQKDGISVLGHSAGSKISAQDFAAKSTKTYYMQNSMQQFFERFAAKRNFDPNLARNWYHVSRQEVFKEPGGRTIVGKYFKGSLIRALRHVFPNIGLERDKFFSRERYFWNHEPNRKQVFLDYAKRNGFDPLVAENWYSQKSRFWEIKKECWTLGSGNVSKTLLHVFPDIGLDIHKLYLPSNTWTSKQNRKNWLISYAKSKGINPTNPQDWYSLNIQKAGTTKELRAILRRFYAGSIKNYLTDVFPELDLSPDKFLHKSKNYWRPAENRRKFFEDFARANGFDPLEAEKWAKIRTSAIKNMKSGQSVLEYYNNSCVSALVDLFPEIGLEKFYPDRKTFYGVDYSPKKSKKKKRKVAL
eukprot:Phypoly_transcript_03576.p1 GENE.Phypoly_transcript_03576~~Phypoly_transcript_03576.p1  ORF type:complete len:754 (+),score=101.52 Phypoly_transcript_03576:123-2384(+)